jgi:hypothetical protein
MLLWLQGIDYCHQHSIQIIQYVVVPESQNLPPLQLQKRGASFVIPNPILMLATVQFNYQHPINADKIGDIRPNRMLAPKTASFQLPAAQRAPQDAFHVRHVATQRPCVERCLFF